MRAPSSLTARWRRRTAARRRAAAAPPLAPGCRQGPPAFVGVGVQRAGTSWWFSLLAAHPAVRPPANGLKELHFFDRAWQRPPTAVDVEEYHRFFQVAGGEISGEWTPSYLFDPWVAPALHLAAPSARLLVLVRDPVARFRSALNHRAALQRRPPDTTSAREAFLRGCYHTQLERLLGVFPRHQVLVLQYERCRLAPAEELARTFAFLELDPAMAPAVRVRTDRPWPEVSGLTDEAEAQLRAAFAPEVAALGRDFPEIDLGLWPAYGIG